MQNFLQHCRSWLKMTEPPTIAPEVLTHLRQHLDASLPSTLVTEYLAVSKFLLHLFCPPHNAPNSPFLEDAIQHIATQLSRLMHATTYQKDTLLACVPLVFQSLAQVRAANQQQAATGSAKAPLSPEFGLYLLHHECTTSGLTPAYEGYILHSLEAIYIRFALEATARQEPSGPLRIQRSLVYDCALSLRYFILYAEAPPVQTGHSASVPTAQAIAQAFITLHADPKRQLKASTVAEHERHVYAAFGHASQRIFGARPRPLDQNPLSPETSWDLPPETLLPGEDPFDDPHHAMTREIHYPPIPRDALEEGECPLEYATVTVVIPKNIEGNALATTIYKGMLAASTAIAQATRYWWDRATLPLLAYLSLLTSRDPTDPRYALAWLIANTGQLPVSLATVQFVHDGAAHDMPLGLDLQRHALVYPQPVHWTGWKRTQHDHLLRDCQHSSEQIIVPLPPEVWHPIAPYLERRLAIQEVLPLALRSTVFVTLDAPHQPISVPSLDDYLKTTTHMSHPFRITAAALARSFWYLYGPRLAVDDLILAYISGRVPFRLRAQMFYVRIMLTRVTRDYGEAAHALAQALRTEAAHVDRASAGSPPLAHALAQRLPCPPAPDVTVESVQLPDTTIAFGSQAVSTEDTIRQFFRLAQRALENLSRNHTAAGRKQYFNLFMIVARQQYAFATGLRPVADARLTFKNCVQSGSARSYMLLGEKANIRFSDVGLIQHTPTAHQIFLSVHQAALHYLNELRANVPSIFDDHELLGQPAFFLIDAEDHIVLMRPTLIRDQLASVGLSEAWQAPLNAPRHYLLTHLFDAKVARPLRDKLARHQHEGQEWLSWLTGTDTCEADTLLCSVIEPMLNTLGITPLQFHPRGRT